MYKIASALGSAKAISTLARVYSLAYLLRLLPQAEYAALAILTSLEGWFMLCDFGIGMSIQIHLPAFVTRKEDPSAFLYTLLTRLMRRIGIALLLSLLLLPWLLSFFFSSLLPQGKGLLFLALGFFFLALQVFGSIASKIYLCQKKEGYFAFCHMLGSLIGVSYLLFSPLSLVHALIAIVGIPASVQGLLGAILLYQHLPAPPSMSQEKKKWLTKTHTLGAIQLLTSCALLFDTILAPKLLSIDTFILYNTLCKIFGIAALAYAVVLQSFLPFCSKQIALQNICYALRKVRTLSLLGIGGIGFFTFLLCVYKLPIERYLGLTLPFPWIFTFASYMALRLVTDFYGAFLQSAHYLRPIFIFLFLQILFLWLLPYYFSPFFSGLGFLLGALLAYALTSSWAFLYYSHHQRKGPLGLYS